MHNVQSIAPEREKNKYSVQNNTCKQRANGKGRLINFGRIPVMSFVPECIRSGAFFFNTINTKGKLLTSRIKKKFCLLHRKLFGL